MTSVRAKGTETGRLSLPADFRKAIGLERGGDVVVELAGKEIRIRPMDEVVHRAQELTRQLLASRVTASVDGFLAERRREAEAE